MYIIDQQIANQIAQSVSLGPMHTWFLAREEEVEEMEAVLINDLAVETGACIIGVAVAAILPLLVEHEGITKFIQKSGDMALRTSLPEITSVKKARKMAVREFNLTEKQAQQVEEKFTQLWSQLLMSKFNQS